jgi:HSP20 family protein
VADFLQLKMGRKGVFMSIVRWSPLTSMLDRWPDVWDDDSLGSLMSGASRNLDVYETDNEVVVRANVAGVNEKDIDITFEKGNLWIKAEKSEEEKDDKKKHYSKSSWNYSYKVAVPGILDWNSEPEVTLKDGVVTLKFKKAEASKPKKLNVKKG